MSITGESRDRESRDKKAVIGYVFPFSCPSAKDSAVCTALPHGVMMIPHAPKTSPHLPSLASRLSPFVFIGALRARRLRPAVRLQRPRRFPIGHHHASLAALRGQAIVRRMWDLMLTGLYSPPKILELANTEWGFRTRTTRKQGNRPLTRSAIYKIFNKPFYYGWFEYPIGSSQWYKGKHEPMITQTEYDRVQMLLGRKCNTRPISNFEFAFTGLIRCGECNRAVTAEEKHQVICGHCRFKFAYRSCKVCPRCDTPIEKMENPKFLHYTYYHCSKSGRPLCSQKYISGLEMEKQISEHLARISISKEFKDWAIKYLHELHEKERELRNDIIQAQQKAYQECLGQIDGLVNLKTSSGNKDGSLLSDMEYAQRRGRLMKEKAALEELLNNAGHRVEQQLKLSEQTFEFACTAQERFAKGDPKTKKEILTTIGSNLILMDKKLLIEARKMYFHLEKALSPANPVISPIEPVIIKVPLGRNVPSLFMRPLLRGEEDDVRTYGYKAERAAALIYAHFKKEFEFPVDQRNDC